MVDIFFPDKVSPTNWCSMVSEPSLGWGGTMDRKEEAISVQLFSCLKTLVREPLCLLAEEASGEGCLECSHHTPVLCVDRYTTCPESGSHRSRFRQNVCSREQ